MRVTGADLTVCSFVLPHPVRLGPVEYHTREYAALRFRTEDPAIVGYAAGHTRGTPLFEGLKLIVPLALGADSADRAAFVASISAARRPGYAALVRALSLVELALWDIAAKQDGLPLHTMLGGVRTTVPALAVCGYFIDERGEDAILADLRRLEAEGFGCLKLMLGMREKAWMLRFLARAKKALAPATSLAVDLHYSIPTLDEGVDLVRALDEFGLAFVEDPFEPARWREMVALRTQVLTPIAAGEDVVNVLQYQDLLEAVAILRVDPSTCGGLAAAVEGIEFAATAGVPVIPHGFTGVNAQLAGGYSTVSMLEVIPVDLAGDGFEAFVRQPFELNGGVAYLDEEPGSGVRLDWEGLVGCAAAVWSADWGA
jgi:L-alanine-DL-glutamate epimerase-like enolase superfamily enzyme